MTDGTRILVGTALPPIVLAPVRSRRSRSLDPFPRLGRIACVLAALALPALGVAATDLVHRVGTPRAPQAAALVTPSDGAAAPEAATRTSRTVRVAVLDGPRQVRP